jgi:hypothetical protein
MSTIEGDKLQMVWDELDYRTEAFAVWKEECMLSIVKIMKNCEGCKLV